MLSVFGRVESLWKMLVTDFFFLFHVFWSFFFFFLQSLKNSELCGKALTRDQNDKIPIKNKILNNDICTYQKVQKHSRNLKEC